MSSFQEICFFVHNNPEAESHAALNYKTERKLLNLVKTTSNVSKSNLKSIDNSSMSRVIENMKENGIKKILSE